MDRKIEVPEKRFSGFPVTSKMREAGGDSLVLSSSGGRVPPRGVGAVS